MTAVIIGVDPNKRSHAMAVLDGRENELAALQISNDNAGYRKMLRLAKRWKQRTWAVEGAGGVGVQLAQRLVADGESVVDIPPKLSTRARIFDTGHGRKTDPGDARPIAVVALRTRNLRQVVLDDERIALRLMADRRRELVRSRTHTVNHLHQPDGAACCWCWAEADRGQGQGAARDHPARGRLVRPTAARGRPDR